LPWYSSVHRGAGYKSRRSTAAYEESRTAVLGFANRPETDVAILCRNTTEAINHLAYRLAFEPGDVVATTVVEHHANLLPWARVARRRFIECERDGTFALEAVVEALEGRPRPKLLTITGASNVTGWLPPIEAICAEAHARGIPVALDAAQLAPHRAIPTAPDYVAFSGHKLYAPYGAGALIGPRSTFETGEPFLAGGGAVDLVDLDEVIWTEPPDREEAGSRTWSAHSPWRAHSASSGASAGTRSATTSAPSPPSCSKAFGQSRGDPPRSGARCRHAGGGRLHGGGPAPRPRRRSAQRRVGHRGSPRLLLRPPLPVAPARARQRGSGGGACPGAAP